MTLPPSPTPANPMTLNQDFANYRPDRATLLKMRESAEAFGAEGKLPAGNEYTCGTHW